MMKLLIIATLIGLGIAVSGCATVVRGTSQTIAIGSTPDGAACVFSRDGQTLATVTTPGSITVQRDRKPINVACTKEGYEEGRGVMNSRRDSSYYPVPLPLVFGIVTLAGQLTDTATGANNHFETSLMMTLEPLSAADRAAGVTGKVTTSPATAPVAVPTRPPAPAPAATTGR